MEKKPVTAIIVGAGHRAMVYSRLAISHPEMLKIVGVADPNPIRRRMVQEKYGFGDDMCFEDAAALAKKGKLADQSSTVPWTNSILIRRFLSWIAVMICFWKNPLR